MQAVIQAIDFAVPDRRVTNDELSASLETSDEWIRSHVGIGSRHIADPEMATSDLAYAACVKVLKRAKVAATDIDMVVVATATPDFVGFPSVACLVQGKLGAINAGAMDLAAGCTGFVYALETAKNYVLSGAARNVLAVGADVLSKIVDWKDRNTCVLFGDGAGAALVSREDGKGNRGILTSVLRADGSGWTYLGRDVGGTRTPFTTGLADISGTYLHMDGQKVYNFAVRVLTEGITGLIASNNLTPDDIAWIVPHQSNRRIIEAAAKRSKIPLEKFYINIEEYANTSAATIPIALTELNDKGLLKKGDLVVTYGVGAGLTHGGNLIRW